MRQSSATSRPGALGLVPWLAWAYPAGAALLGRSEVPVVLGRWSVAAVLFNAGSLVLLALGLWAWRRGAPRLLGSALALLVLLTFAAPASNQIRALPGISWYLPLVRLLSGVALAVLAFELQRRGRPARGWLAAAALVATLSLFDFALLGVIAVLPEHRRPEAVLREEYAFDRVSGRDVILVGDSFVWGQGVAPGERFGDRLEARLRGAGESGRVYSLGLIGAGLPQYARLLERLPADAVAGRVVVAFYMNDMPPIETPLSKVQDLSVALGRSSPSARLVGDQVAKLLAGDVEDYHRYVVESFRPDRASYGTRWALLAAELRRVHALAARHSAAPPGLVLLPLMVDYSSYPLAEAHERVAALGREAGYEVLDLWPTFRQALADGRAHRADPGDNHFDAATHALVADVLYGWLRPAGGQEPPAPLPPSGIPTADRPN